MFITLEGPDCSGKDTQAALLAEHLNAVLFHFPDRSTRLGKLIDAHLKSQWSAVPVVPGVVEEALDPLVFQGLQTLNRFERLAHLRECLLGRNVIAVRYTASGEVYGGLDGVDRSFIRMLNASLPEPDLCILLNVSPEVARRRLRERGMLTGAPSDRYEASAEYQHRVAHAYLTVWEWHQIDDLSRDLPKRYVTVDGNGDVGAVQEAIRALCAQAPRR